MIMILPLPSFGKGEGILTILPDPSSLIKFRIVSMHGVGCRGNPHLLTRFIDPFDRISYFHGNRYWTKTAISMDNGCRKGRFLLFLRGLIICLPVICSWRNVRGTIRVFIRLIGIIRVVCLYVFIGNRILRAVAVIPTPEPDCQNYDDCDNYVFHLSSWIN